MLELQKEYEEMALAIHQGLGLGFRLLHYSPSTRVSALGNHLHKIAPSPPLRLNIPIRDLLDWGTYSMLGD